MPDKTEEIILQINETAKKFRVARGEIFEKHELSTVVYWEMSLIVGIGKRQASVRDTQRTTVLEVIFTPQRQMLQMGLKGVTASPAEISVLQTVLADFLKALAARKLIAFSEAAFKALGGQTTDKVRDHHWRTVALPVPIHHGDLIVLKSPTPNPVTGTRVQVLMAYRANPTAPLGAADISTGKVIPNFVLQQGRAAKLTPASAQHISRDLMRTSDIKHLLKHQIDRDRQKASKLSGARA